MESGGCEMWMESRGEGFNRKFFKFRDFIGWCLWISVIVLVLISRDFQLCHCQIYQEESNRYFNPYGHFVDQEVSWTNRSESVSYPVGMMADVIRGRATTTPAPVRWQGQGHQGWGNYGMGNRNQVVEVEEVEDFGMQQGQRQQQMGMQGQQQMGMQGQQQMGMQGQQQMGMQGQQQMGMQGQQQMGMQGQQQIRSESPESQNQYHGHTVEYESQLSPPLVVDHHTHSFGDFQEYHHTPVYSYPPVYHHKRPPPPIRIPRGRLSWLNKKRRHIHDRFMAHMNQRRQSQETQMAAGGTTAAVSNSGETFLDGLMMPAAFVALSMLTMDILGRLFPFGSGRGGWKATTTTTPPPKITKIEISPPRIPILSDIIELKTGFFDSVKKKKAHIHKFKKDKYKKFHDKFKNFHDKFKGHDKKKNSYGWSSSSEEDYVGRSPSGKRTSSKKGGYKGEKKYPRYTWQRLQQLYNEQIQQQQESTQGR